MLILAGATTVVSQRLPLMTVTVARGGAYGGAGASPLARHPCFYLCPFPGLSWRKLTRYRVSSRRLPSFCSWGNGRQTQRDCLVLFCVSVSGPYPGGLAVPLMRRGLENLLQSSTWACRANAEVAVWGPTAGDWGEDREARAWREEAYTDSRPCPRPLSTARAGPAGVRPPGP